MLDTLTSNCKADFLSKEILSSIKSLVNSITNCCLQDNSKEFYNSEENKIRSLNIFYSQNVMGKQKYISVRKANRSPKIINFVPYSVLSSYISEIDVGHVYNIKPKFTEELNEDEIGDGMYRDILEYAPHLAKFYLAANDLRLDKLKEFNINERYTKKDPLSFLFVMALGGDEAPGSGTTFLLSFLNVGKRITSSFENVLLFGGNVKENGIVVRRFVTDLIPQIKILENEVFKITVNEKMYKVEFMLDALPNDMKMLAFLSGKLAIQHSIFLPSAMSIKLMQTMLKKLSIHVEKIVGNHFLMKKDAQMSIKLRRKKLNFQRNLTGNRKL